MSGAARCLLGRKTPYTPNFVAATFVYVARTVVDDKKTLQPGDFARMQQLVTDKLGKEGGWQVKNLGFDGWPTSVYGRLQRTSKQAPGWDANDVWSKLEAQLQRGQGMAATDVGSDGWVMRRGVIRFS